jgi:DNA-binding NarL/FixJ family response regulator
MEENDNFCFCIPASFFLEVVSLLGERQIPFRFIPVSSKENVRVLGISELSHDELLILRMLAEGKTYKVISKEAHISIHTVNFRIKLIYRKLNVHTKVDAVRAYLSGISI